MATFGVARVRNVSRCARLIGLVLAALISAIYATWFAQRPLYNWEMIPYVAIALLDAGQPADTLREKTYDIVKKSTPIERHEFLLGGSNYNKDTYIRGADYRYMVARDLKIFADQLPFYTVKPVYPALMSLFVRAGVNPVTATMIISGAAYAAICFLLYVWISQWLIPALSLLLAALLSLNPILTPLAQLATPDALSVFVLLLGSFFVIETRFLRSGIGIFIASILIRPENIIYAFIFLVFLAAIRRLALTSCAIGLCVALESILPRRDLARITVGQPYSILLSLIGGYCKAALRIPWACLTMHTSTPRSCSGLFFRVAQRSRCLRWFASAHYC